MYKNIIIATDGSEVGEKAVNQGLELAKAIGAKVTLVKVTEMWSPYEVAGGTDGAKVIERFEAAAAKAAKKILDEAATKAKALGVAADTYHVKDRVPADGILAAASERGADLIIMGSHGRRGLQRILLGSQATDVLTHSPITVMICK